jgi:hypothetical protein
MNIMMMMMIMMMMKTKGEESQYVLRTGAACEKPYNY